MEAHFFHDNIYVEAVHINVTNIKSSTAFYTNVLGLSIIEINTEYTAVGTTQPLIYLHQAAQQASASEAALYHIALLVPDQQTLGNVLKHFDTIQQPLSDTSFHSVCKSIYTKDPDGHTIEIYHDLPHSAWQYNQDGTIVLGIHPLDLSTIQAAADEQPFNHLSVSTVIGHIHLEVLDLYQSIEFYEQLFNMKVTAMNGHFSAFMSTGHYHHHIALNRWNQKTKAVMPKSTGIRKIEFACRSTEDKIRFRQKTMALGLEADNCIKDPNGIEIDVNLQNQL